MRGPRVENKYQLTIPKIKKLKVRKSENLKELGFWWNEAVKSWCVIEEAGDDSYWIGISEKGKFKFTLDAYEGMCSYNFKEFFRPDDMENEWDLEIQEKFLSKINFLIDEGVLNLPS